MRYGLTVHTRTLSDHACITIGGVLLQPRDGGRQWNTEAHTQQSVLGKEELRDDY